MTIKKMQSSFSSSDDIPGPEERAKAVYNVLLLQGKDIVQDILSVAPEEFKDSKEYKAFLGNEIGVIMCLHSTREGYEGIFADSREKEIFVDTLFRLFKHHLQISWDVFELYINFGKDAFKMNHEAPDKIFMQIFSSRIVAFLNHDDEPFTEKEKTLSYSWYPEAVIYWQIYVRIFESICQILSEFAGKSADTEKILVMAEDLDERLK